MVGKISLSTLSVWASLIDLEKTCATVNRGFHIEGLSFRNLQKTSGTMKPRRSKRASGSGRTIGQVLEGELSSEENERENAASVLGRAAWVEEVQPQWGERP